MTSSAPFSITGLMSLTDNTIDVPMLMAGCSFDLSFVLVICKQINYQIQYKICSYIAKIYHNIAKSSTEVFSGSKHFYVVISIFFTLFNRLSKLEFLNILKNYMIYDKICLIVLLPIEHIKSLRR